MKFVKILICVTLFTLYGYSCHMISVDSKHLIWGYICAIDFGILFMILALFINRYQKKKENEKNNSEKL